MHPSLPAFIDLPEHAAQEVLLIISGTQATLTMDEYLSATDAAVAELANAVYGETLHVLMEQPHSVTSAVAVAAARYVIGETFGNDPRVPRHLRAPNSPTVH